MSGKQLIFSQASGYRLGIGLLLAIITGIPIGILMGRSNVFRKLSNTPFQFLRMVSPLSWEPIAVIAMPTWDQAIIFLISMAAVWPVAFATAAGLAKLDRAWFKVARNLGASWWDILKEIILPAIAFDVMTGIRLALGVAWMDLVEARCRERMRAFETTLKEDRAKLAECEGGDEAGALADEAGALADEAVAVRFRMSKKEVLLGPLAAAQARARAIAES